MGRSSSPARPFFACPGEREEDTQRLATETLARFGGIDVLVNNAAVYGTLTRRPFMEIPVEEGDRVMAVNLRGLFLCTRAVFSAMKARGKGMIINIASSTSPARRSWWTAAAASTDGTVGYPVPGLVASRGGVRNERDVSAAGAQMSRPTKAPIPKAVMMAPARRLTHRSPRRVSAERKQPTPVLSRSHQSAEPRKTPSTMSAAGP